MKILIYIYLIYNFFIKLFIKLNLNNVKYVIDDYKTHFYKV